MSTPKFTDEQRQDLINTAAELAAATALGMVGPVLADALTDDDTDELLERANSHAIRILEDSAAIVANDEKYTQYADTWRQLAEVLREKGGQK